MTDLEQFQKVRIEKLCEEIERLNQVISELKNVALKAKLSDPNYLKPITHLEVDFKIVKP